MIVNIRRSLLQYLPLSWPGLCPAKLTRNVGQNWIKLKIQWYGLWMWMCEPPGQRHNVEPSLSLSLPLRYLCSSSSSVHCTTSYWRAVIRICCYVVTLYKDQPTEQQLCQHYHCFRSIFKTEHLTNWSFALFDSWFAYSLGNYVLRILIL